MKTWTDLTIKLSATDHPAVCRHADNISFSLPGYMTDGHGFSIHFVPAHLPQLQKLLDELEGLALRQARGAAHEEAVQARRAAARTATVRESENPTFPTNRGAMPRADSPRRTTDETGDGLR
jgi:hypothetical protein